MELAPSFKKGTLAERSEVREKAAVAWEEARASGEDGFKYAQASSRINSEILRWPEGSYRPWGFLSFRLRPKAKRKQLIWQPGGRGCGGQPGLRFSSFRGSKGGS